MVTTVKSGVASDSWWAELRDAAELHPTVLKTRSLAKNYSSQNINSPRAENP